MRIVFTGDICFNKYFRESWYDASCLQKDVEAYLHAADHVIGNIEGALTKKDYDRVNTQVHASDPGAASFLSQHNIRIWNLSNNHIMDCGEDGLLETLSCAESQNCRTVGAGRTCAEACSAILLGEETRVGVLSVAKPWSYILSDENKAGAFTWDKISFLEEAIQELKKEARWIVLIIHGGEEFSDVPLPTVREKYLQLLNLGADIVVGHHPHVVQPYERVGNGIVFYSLGNFIFDTDYQRSFLYTDTGILLGVDFDKDCFRFDHLTVRVNRDTQTVEAAPNTPVIFFEITEKDYQLLWPLAARRLYNINKKKWRLTQRRFSHTNGALESLHMLSCLRHKDSRTIAEGKMKSWRKQWKLSSRPELCSYLLQE